MNARERLLDGTPVTERRTRFAGIPTALLEGGEGPPMVLLHGPGESGAKWFGVMPDLVRTHRVIAPDLPGHGESAAMDAPADHVLAWLDELVQATCDQPPVLVGQIVGGAIAARYAAAHPERVGHLVLVDTLGLAPFQPTPEFGAALGAFLAHPDETTHDDLWRRCAFDLDGLRTRLGERWRFLKAYNLDRAHAPGLGPTQESLMAAFGFPAIAPEQLRAIRTRTSLIWGRHDLATNLQVAEAAAARYGWPLRVIDAAGDDPAIEQPAAFVAALRAALGSA